DHAVLMHVARLAALVPIDLPSVSPVFRKNSRRLSFQPRGSGVSQVTRLEASGRPFGSRRRRVAILFLIVSRNEPSRLTYLKHVFAGDTVDVILDRRLGERRQRW